jgi:hypothetical protein
LPIFKGSFYLFGYLAHDLFSLLIKIMAIARIKRT